MANPKVEFSSTDYNRVPRTCPDRKGFISLMEELFSCSDFWMVKQQGKAKFARIPKNKNQIDLFTDDLGFESVIKSKLLKDNQKQEKTFTGTGSKKSPKIFNYKTIPNSWSSYKDSVAIQWLDPRDANIQQIITIGTTGKSGETINAAAMTKAQEMGSAFVFKRALKHDDRWTSWEKLKEDDTVSTELNRIWKDVVGLDRVTNDWYKNFYAQNKKLLQVVGSHQFTEFERDGDFMDWVTGYVRDNGWAAGGKKDNWNPADIWIMTNKWRDWIKVLEDATSVPRSGAHSNIGTAIDIQLLQFNAIMRALFRKKEIWGISLKKVNKDIAEWAEVNVHWDNDADKKLGFNQMKAMRYTYDSTNCDCGRKEDKSGTIQLATQDTKLNVKGAGSTMYKFQIKANDSTKFSGLKYEPTDDTAGAARLGKATVDYVEDLFKKYAARIKFTGSKDDYPQDPDEFLNQKDKWIHVIGRVKDHGVTIQTSTALEAYNNILLIFNSKPFVSNSKLMQLSWLDSFFSINGKDNRDKFLTDMVFIAQKMGRRYGPFGKLY
tara:strand:- start:2774 stop:4414 length:1641 start_codon:yes stop_codon:yes gene_type:complete